MPVSVRVKHSKVDIQTRGCLDCGTEFSCGWYTGDEIMVRIAGRKPFIVVLNRCEDCQRKLGLRARLNGRYPDGPGRRRSKRAE